MESLSLTVISAHFGDQSWINYSLKTLCQNSELISHAFISDQKQIRRDAWDSYPALNLDADLETKFTTISVISVDPHQINHSSLHHGQTLNSLINLKIETSHVLILDSDCFPLDNKWESQLISDLKDFDVIVAGDPQGNLLSHPCFMILPVNVLSQLDFIEYTETHWIDTGRLIGIRCLDMGLKVKVLSPERGPINFGHIYKPYNFFHVGSSSFRWRPEAHQIAKSINDLKYDFMRSVSQSHPELLLKNHISSYELRKLKLRHFFAYLLFSKNIKPLILIRIQRKLKFYKDSLFKNSPE
jgi:hypothetical protein